MAGLYIGVGASVGYDEYESKVNVREKCVVVDDTMVGRLGYDTKAKYASGGTQTTDIDSLMTVMIESEIPQIIDKIPNVVSLKNNDANDLVNKIWCANNGTWSNEDIYINDEIIIGNKYIPIKLYDHHNQTTNPNELAYIGDYCFNKNSGIEQREVYTQLYSKDKINDKEIINVDQIYYYKNNQPVYLKSDDDSLTYYHIHYPSTKKLGECLSVSDFVDIHSAPDAQNLVAFNTQSVDEVAGYPINLYLDPIININWSSEPLFNGTQIDPKKSSYMTQKSLSRSGKNKGIELKMSYFHDFGNHIMAGLDLTGAVLTKNKQSINAAQYSNLTLWGTESGIIAHAEYKDGQYVTKAAPNAQIAKNEKLVLSPTLPDANQVKLAYSTDPVDGTYIDATKGNKDVSFEKGIFNPKLAFVVGGTYNGWFAGLRAGVSYNTGKVKTSDMTSCKNVSVASPLVGVHVMKKVSNDTNIYMTADWNVGDLSKSVDMNGVKSFKHSGYNISAGVTWKCNIGI